MALNQVGARTQGDVYQGLFFWRQAADLLRPTSLVNKVILEHDDAAGVDDIAVFYRDPGVNAGGWTATADYYQLKYHVDNRAAYSSDALIDRAFLGGKSSLLERFHAAYTRLASEHSRFRLHLASNWRWEKDDKLAARLREYDGALPKGFFEGGERSDLGRIRTRWREHLNLDPNAFTEFARTLRFELDHFGRRHFKAYVYATLEAAGLRPPSADRAACPYESLIQQFLMDGPNSFDTESFRELCEREGLMLEAKPPRPRPISVGIRSFVRFAERLEAEVDEIVCVSHEFAGRHARFDSSWETSATRVLDFFSQPERRARLRGTESVIALECHGSLALVAGWELSRNSGVRTAPLQKPNLVAWRPSTESTPCDEEWHVRVLETEENVADVALCLSITHDVVADVEEYLSTPDSPAVGCIVQLTPEGGASPESIRGADHAYQLASQVPKVLASARRNRRGRTHIFFASPNALMFFIGQLRDALGPVVLYEFDFGLEHDGSYRRSLSLPFPDDDH